MMMSRMAALVLASMSAPAAADTNAIEVYLDRTSAEPRCKRAVGDEIMVCGRREADKYRLPFVPAPTPGDPKIVNVPAERARLVATETPCEQMGPYLVGCGMVGVSISTKIGSGKVEYRRLAP
jgi:hypothetical protein